MLTRLLFANVLIFVLIGAWLGIDETPGRGQTRETPHAQRGTDFVGSKRCASCHAKEFADWSASHHALAMQEATEKTVLAKFDGRTFEKDGVTSTFFKKDGAFWVRTDGPDGKLADFRVRYTFGVAPLQQYLIALPGGRLQALGIAWDTRSTKEGGQRWYHLYPDQTLRAGSAIHWTGIDQNWNHQCAWCHSTNLQKNYDLETRTFQTTWSEISVGCEACHGPASGHINWVAKGQRKTDPGKGFALSFNERRNVAWPMDAEGQAKRSMPRRSVKEIENCAACHARRGQFSAKPSDMHHFTDAFRPSLLEQGLYFPDGQQRDEVYKYGSFLQSKMYAAGVTCSDCHNPHSGKLRKEGNALCAQCHGAEQFDTPAHHHHPANTDGAKCTACHMPTTTYMGVDKRHDHSLRIPRPDRTVTLGTPNACNGCHTGKSAAWAQDAIKSWFPKPNRGAQSFAEAFHLGDLGAPGAVPALLAVLNDGSSSAIARASALHRLGWHPTPEVLAAAVASLKDRDPSVRSAAVSIVGGGDATVRRSLLVPLLTDASRLVRMDAARALAGEAEAGLDEKDRTAFEQALSEYVAAQLFDAERPESHTNLGQLYRVRGMRAQARTAFATAIKLDPSFVSASIALADLDRADIGEASAESVLRSALSANPNSGQVQHALALSLVRQKRMDEAMLYLAKAFENAPEAARYGYVLAVALHDSGRRDEAIEVLGKVLKRHPYDRGTLQALTMYRLEMRELSAALESAELLNKLEPNRPDILRLIARLRRHLQR